MVLEVFAHEKAGGRGETLLVEQKGEQNSGNTAVAVHKGVDDKELPYNDRDLDQRLSIFCPNVLFQIFHRLGEDFGVWGRK